MLRAQNCRSFGRMADILPPIALSRGELMQVRTVVRFLGLTMLCMPLRAEDFVVIATPEPGTIALFATGFGGLILLHRKMRKKG